MKKHFIAIIIVIAIAFVAYRANAYITYDTQTSVGRITNFDFFASSTNPVSGSDATSTSATSTNINAYFDPTGRYVDGSFNISGSKNVTLYFIRQADATGNAGSSTYSVQVTPDGSNWYNFNMLTQNVATTTSPGATISSLTQAGTSTAIVGMELRWNSFKAIRCIVTRQVDGAAICKATATY